MKIGRTLNSRGGGKALRVSTNSWIVLGLWSSCSFKSLSLRLGIVSSLCSCWATHNDYSELPGKPLVCFRQKYSGSSSALPAEPCWQQPPILQLRSLHFLQDELNPFSVQRWTQSTSALFSMFKMLKLVLSSPTPQLIEKHLLAQWQCVPHQSCHLQPSMFQLPAQTWCPCSSSSPSTHRLSVSVAEASCHFPLSARHRLKQLSICMLKNIKGEEKAPTKHKLKLLGTWILFSLTAPGGTFQSTWIYTVRLSVSCDVGWWSNQFNVFTSWCYMCCFCRPLWAEACYTSQGAERDCCV